MDDALRTQILTRLGAMGESAATQEVMLAQVESIADKRLAYLLPQLLSLSQLETLNQHALNGVTAAELKQWMIVNAPHGEELVRSMLLDVAEEAVGWLG